MASPHLHDSPAAVISYPSIIALYDEDIIDAAHHTGLHILAGTYHLPREVVAAYAGYGMGFCQSYWDRDKCREEGHEFPFRHTLLVEYTEESLPLHRERMATAVHYSDFYSIDARASFDLGRRNHHQHGHAERIKDFIRGFLRHVYRYLDMPEKISVIMTGDTEMVTDGPLRMAIEAAIEEFGSKAELLTLMPEFIASRGAAELAWRALALKSGSPEV